MGKRRKEGKGVLGGGGGLKEGREIVVCVFSSTCTCT